MHKQRQWWSEEGTIEAVLALASVAVPGSVGVKWIPARLTERKVSELSSQFYNVCLAKTTQLSKSVSENRRELCTFTCTIKVLLSYDNDYNHTCSPSRVLYRFLPGFSYQFLYKVHTSWFIGLTNVELAMTYCTYSCTCFPGWQNIMVT